MIFGKTKLEMKVGIFVFIGLVILAIFVLSIGGFKTWSSGRRFKVNFGFVNGVKVGAPVRFAGVDVGAVKSVELQFLPAENRTNVCLDIWVKKDARIPVDSEVWVNTLGLLGEKYIEIMPGRNYSNYVKEKQSIRGIDPLPMHELLKSAESILNNVDKGVISINNQEGTLGKLIYDDTIYNELEALVSDVRRHPWKLFYKTKEKKK